MGKGNQFGNNNWRFWKKYVNYNVQLPSPYTGKNFAFFITPKQKNKFLGSVNCWRQCGCQEANHFHIFWDCPNRNILGTPIDCSFEVIYLGIVPMVSWERRNKYIFRIILALSKIAITRWWYKPNPPQIQDWIEVLKVFSIWRELHFMWIFRLTLFL